MSRLVVALAVLALLAFASARPAIDLDLIAEINGNPASLWTAGVNPRFLGVSLEEVEAMLMHGDVPEPAAPIKTYAGLRDLPAAFNSSSKWGSCIHPVRNQGQCGSCWAFGATEVLGDRTCIAGAPSVGVLSPQDLVSCDTEEDGCQGGNLDTTWAYLASTGVVTEECFPYESSSGVAPACRKSCVSSSVPFLRHKASSHYQLSGVNSIQQDIMSYGPVEAGFAVYQDFLSYQSGVYVCPTNGTALGGHAIKIVGWGSGSTPAEDHWVVQNSWGQGWGLDGFFWIQRGTDTCGIEDNVFAGHAATTKRSVFLAGNKQ
jgi:cathepsin B